MNTQWKGLTIRDKVEGERVIPLTPYVGLTQGLYKGCKADTDRHAAIADMLNRGMFWSQVCAATGASRSTWL